MLAGAGSGKTRVLTHRVAHLVATGQAKPSEILAITFTNKAAREMRDRVEGLVGRHGARDVGDDVPLRLRAHPARRGGAARLHERASRSTTRPTRCASCGAASTSSAIDPKRFAPRAIKSQISRAKNQLEDAAAYREQVGSFFEQTVADVYELYEQRIHEMNALDFDDLLFRTVNVLELFPDVARALPAARSAGSSWTSTRTPTTPSTGCCSCSPARSATSAWSATTTSRSTASAARTSATSSTSSATSPARTVVKLEQNYRSTQTILSAANAVVSHNEGRKPKQLWTDLGEGEPVHVASSRTSTPRRATSPPRSSACATRRASRASEVAVFYRTNAQSRVLEDTLVRFGVAYQVIGGTKFYERAEIKDALAYLTLLVEPAATRSRSRAS